MNALITFQTLTGSCGASTSDPLPKNALIKVGKEVSPRNIAAKKGTRPEPGRENVPRPILIEAKHTIIATTIRTMLLIWSALLIFFPLRSTKLKDLFRSTHYL